MPFKNGFSEIALLILKMLTENLPLKMSSFMIVGCSPYIPHYWRSSEICQYLIVPGGFQRGLPACIFRISAKGSIGGGLLKMNFKSNAMEANKQFDLDFFNNTASKKMSKTTFLSIYRKCIFDII